MHQEKYFIMGLVMLFGMTKPVFAQQSESYAYAQDVFNKIVRTINLNTHQKPVLEVVPGNTCIAKTSANGTVQVGYGLIEKCRSFGQDSAHAFAHVVSHELVHYYSDQFWSAQYGSAYADAEWGQHIAAAGATNEMSEISETQADVYGMYFAFAAGYRTHLLGDRVLDSIYSWYGLPEIIPGYPSLVERKRIALQSKEQIATLIPVFESANLCLTLAQSMHGQLQAMLAKTAYMEFDDILSRKILTKEIYNNAAIARIISVMYLQPDSLQYIHYPFMTEAGSILYKADQSRSSAQQLSAEQIAFREQLIEEAKILLNAAIKTDKQFYPAYLNLAIANFLTGNYGSASDALLSCKKIMGDAHPLIAAVYEMQALNVYAQTGEVNYTLFTLAKDKGSNTSTYHVALCTQKNGSAVNNWTAQDIQYYAIDTTEVIDGVSIFKTLDQLTPNRNGRFDLSNEQLILYTDTGALYHTFYIRANFKPAYQKLRFLQTKSGATGQTSKGLAIGNTSGQLEKIYGKPNQVSYESLAMVYHYPQQNLLVWVRDNRVEKWCYWWLK